MTHVSTELPIPIPGWKSALQVTSPRSEVDGCGAQPTRSARAGGSAHGAPSADGLVPAQRLPVAARVSVVIPALNEAANLPHVFARLPAGLHEVIVVDGHSTDDTVRVARHACPGARIVLQDGRGKGNALGCGFAAARGDIIVMLDADGSTDPAEIPRFVAALLDGTDFAKGSRFLGGGGSVDITLLRKAGNRALNGLVNLLFGTSYTDLCYGYNAFWARCLPVLSVTCAGFEVETLMNVRVARAKLAFVEVPSREAERLTGASKLRPFRDGWRVLRTIVCERVRRRPCPEASWPPTFREIDADADSLAASA
jgi:Glycosyl transferase family 2